MEPKWNEFASSTTVHGLRFINSSSSLQRKIVWGIFVLVGAGFLFSQVITTISTFYQFKVNTVVRLSHDKITMFPAITICNSNVLRKSKIEALKHDKRVQRLMLLSKNYMFVNNSNGKNVSSNATLSGKELREVYFALGHSMESLEKGGMLEYCGTPDHGKCYSKSFSRTLTYSGLCYTLNHGQTNHKLINTSTSGRFSSVKIGLSVQVEEYSLSLSNSQSVGFTVLIHDQRDPPFADTHGMLIGPGVHASIGIKKRKVESKKFPYESNCRDGKLSEGIPYSRLGCLRECEENFVIKKCGCTMPVDTFAGHPNTSICDMVQTFNCAIREATESFPQQRSDCECPFACQSVEYTTSLSQAPYPTEPRGRQYAMIELKKEKKNLTEYNIQRKLASIRKNRVLLEIFYEQLDYMTIKQIPASTTVGLIAAIGGLLGISLGASLLTILEMVDFLFFYVIKKLSFTRKRQAEVTSSMQNSRD